MHTLAVLCIMKPSKIRRTKHVYFQAYSYDDVLYDDARQGIIVLFPPHDYQNEMGPLRDIF